MDLDGSTCALILTWGSTVWPAAVISFLYSLTASASCSRVGSGEEGGDGTAGGRGIGGGEEG